MYARDFRQRAWADLSGKWGIAILAVLIVSLIEGALGGLSTIGIGAIGLLLIMGPLSLGLAQMFLNIVRGQKAEIGDIFNGFKNFLNSFLLALLNWIFTALWSLLFIIPGIIASYRYSMSFYILADNPGMDANTARVRSIEMMKGNKWRLFCLDFSFIGWYLLCALTFGILTLWVAPYHETARTEFYQELLRTQGNGGYNQHGNPYGSPDYNATKSSGFDGQTNGATQNSGNVASAFGTGYRPNPDMELNQEEAKTPENNCRPDTADQPSESSGGRPDPSDQPPLNADDL